MSNDIKSDYYSNSEITKNYDKRRFGRGGGAYVASTEEDSLLKLIARIELEANSSAIDCPTGSGRFIPLLKKAGYRVSAVDISESMIALAKNQNADEYLVASSDNVPFLSSSIDLWLMSRFCFHFQDPSRFLKEAARVVKPGGHLIADFYNWTPRTWIPGKQEFLGGRTYLHSNKKVELMATNLEWKVIEVLPIFFIAPYIYSFLPLAVTRTIEKLSDAIAPSFKTKSYYLLKRI